MDLISLIIIIALSLIVLFLFYTIIKAKASKQKDAKPAAKPEEKKEEKKPQTSAPSGNLVINKKFMHQTEVDFMNALIKSLPNFCVVMAKVSLKSIIKPSVGNFNSDDVYNQIIDFCIFNQRTMTPILIVDLYNVDFEKKNIDTQNKQVTEILRKAGLTTVFFQTKNEYDKEEIKREILQAIS